MITVDALKLANDSVNAIEIKTKDGKTKPYVCVAARVDAFRKICPDGGIVTRILNLEDGVVVMQATIHDENGTILATGTAYEKESVGFINKTSYIENCETSAVGRALANLGIGSAASLASAEEMVNALNAQNDNRIKDAEYKAEALSFIMETICPDNWDKIANLYGVEKVGDMSADQLRDYRARYEKHENARES